MKTMTAYETHVNQMERVVAEKRDYKFGLVYDDVDHYEIVVYKKGTLIVAASCANKETLPLAMALFGIETDELYSIAADDYIDQIVAYYDKFQMPEYGLAALDALQVALYDN